VKGMNPYKIIKKVRHYRIILATRQFEALTKLYLPFDDVLSLQALQMKNQKNKTGTQATTTMTIMINPAVLNLLSPINISIRVMVPIKLNRLRR
jgi:hypothetical protein